MKNPIAIAAGSACPVCGQRLSPSESICNECGAILALRMARARRPVASMSRFTPLFRRGFVALSSFLRDRRGFFIIVALLLTALTFAAVAGIFARRNAVETAPRVQRSEVKRPAVVEDQRPLGRSEKTVESVAPSMTGGSRSPLGGFTTLGMIFAAVLGALLCAVPLRSAQRRAQDRAAENAGWIDSRRMTQAASVGAAFCFGLAAALAVVLVTDSRMVQPPAALATVQRERADYWRREASTLSERLSVLDARLASLESTRAGEGQTRPQATRAGDRLERDRSRTRAAEQVARPVDVMNDQESSAIPSPLVSALEQTSTKISTADVLRSPRVPTASLGDRVWDDIVRDWDRVKRGVRELLSRESR